MDLFLTNTHLFTLQDVYWWLETSGLLRCFLSSVWTHSDGAHSLQMIHWWASDVILINVYIFDGLRVIQFTAIFDFWVWTIHLIIQLFGDLEDKMPLTCPELSVGPIFKYWTAVHTESQPTLPPPANTWPLTAYIVSSIEYRVISLSRWDVVNSVFRLTSETQR